MLHRLLQGEVPKGTFSGRTNNPGIWPHSGHGALTGAEHWELSAVQFTDMCAVRCMARPFPVK
jgi:hypothetical protein